MFLSALLVLFHLILTIIEKTEVYGGCLTYLMSQCILSGRALFETGLPWQFSWLGICLQCRRPRFDSWVGKIHWRRDRLPTPVFLGFPCGSAGKESACNVEDLGSIPGLGRSPGEGKGYPLQYSGLENSIDCTVHGVTKSQTWWSDFHFLHSHFVQLSGSSAAIAHEWSSQLPG